MKKSIALLLFMCLSLCLFGCNSNSSPTQSSNSLNSSSSAESQESYEERLAKAEESMRQKAEAAENWEVRVPKAWYQATNPPNIITDVQNDTDVAIKDVQLDIAAWDVNGLPVLLRFTNSGSISSYFFSGSMDGVNIPAGGSTAGRDLGFTLAQQVNAATTVKAIVAKYTDFNGNTVENPNGAAWRGYYDNGRPL